MPQPSYAFRGILAAAAISAALPAATASPGSGAEKFEQLGPQLRSPNVYRNAAGAPGPQYWQQRADYDIEVTLDEQAKRIDGSETITYHNNSPQPLRYIWIQLEQNRFKDDSKAWRSRTAESTDDGSDRLSYEALRRSQAHRDHDNGFEIESVTTAAGKPLGHTIVDTMMRVDLPEPLGHGEQFSFAIDWSFNIVEEVEFGARGGYEHFEDSDTYIYFLAQWFPRLAAYTDYGAWQNKAFLGRGEFALEFGSYEVSINVPADHIVSATGVLQNPEEVLTPTQRERLASARGADQPRFIVTPEEAEANEAEATDQTKTWHFQADFVRDFAWSSSRKFIWDAMGHQQPDTAEHSTVMAMSFYPNEAEPVWSKYSTHAVAHTMDVYSRFSFAYPYPKAQSINTWESGGMEYPMVTFNGYRPDQHDEDDDIDKPTYSRDTKYGLIGVIIHEIGHIYFPMTVNSDERQWTWMDEGLNTFLQYTAQLEWEADYPMFGGGPNVLDDITSYMVSEDQVPIMTQSDSVLQFGNNAYLKPTAALTVLRETVLGREQFDFAFREYARRWKFKRPTPADFFRTMEDAAGADLDWFWRGWFYSTDHVDVGIADLRQYKVSSQDPEKEFPKDRKENEREHPEPLTQIRNRKAGRDTRVERIPELEDFYNEHDQFTVSNKDRNEYKQFREGLEDWEKEVLDRAVAEGNYVYFVDFVNHGGLVTPLPLKITYQDDSTERLKLPAELWRQDAKKVTKRLIRPKRIESIVLDDHHQIADADHGNNHFPRELERSRLELYKDKEDERDLMADMLVELKGEGKDDCDCDDDDVPMDEAEAQ